jgi:CubicO group peptidase (beta-lactamase class C family)
MKPNAEPIIDAACGSWAKENPAGFGMDVRRGVVLFNKGYGQTDGKPATADTPAILASLTKFLWAILLLEMVDQSLLDLDDPVDRHIPTLRGIKVRRAMTIRDLYMHTCGFSDAAK